MGRLTTAEQKAIADAKAKGEDYSRYMPATPKQVQEITGGSTPPRVKVKPSSNIGTAFTTSGVSAGGSAPPPKTTTPPSSSSGSSVGKTVGFGGINAGGSSAREKRKEVESTKQVDVSSLSPEAREYYQRHPAGQRPATLEQVSMITGQRMQDIPGRGQAAGNLSYNVYEFRSLKQKEYKEAEDLYKEFKKEGSMIRPTRFYQFQDPKTGAKITAPGYITKNIFYNKKKEQEFKDYVEGTKNIFLESQKLPTGIIIKATNKGYDITPVQKDTMKWITQRQADVDLLTRKNYTKGKLAEIGLGFAVNYANLIKESSKYIAYTGQGVNIPGKGRRPLFTEKSLYKPLQAYSFPTIWDAPSSSPEGQFVKSHPYYAIGSIGAEVSQLAAFSYAEPISPMIKAGVKGAVLRTPKVVSKLKTFTGASRPLFESESELLEGGFKVVGRRPTLTTKTFGYVSKAGRTPFWKHISGWADDSLVRARVLPAKSVEFLGDSRTGIKIGSKNYFSKVTKFKGWGKTEWVYSDIAARFKPGYSKDVVNRLMPSSTPEGEIAERIIMTSYTGKPTGNLWYKSLDKVETSITSSTRSGFGAGTFGSWYRYPQTSKSIVAIRTKPIKATGFLKSTDASATVIPSLSYRPMISTGTGSGSIMGQWLGNVIVPGSFFGTSYKPIVGLGISSIKAIDLDQYQKQPQMQNQVSRLNLSQTVGLQPLNTSITRSLSANDIINRQTQGTDQGIKQLQKQLQASIQKSSRKYNMVIPLQQTQLKMIAKPFNFGKAGTYKPKAFMFSDKDIYKPQRYRMPKMANIGRGYRQRKWKTPETMDLLPDIKKMMKKFAF